MASHQDGLKIRSSKSSEISNGIKTDVICYNFANQIFIILTQFGRPGTMVTFLVEYFPASFSAHFVFPFRAKTDCFKELLTANYANLQKCISNCKSQDH